MNLFKDFEKRVRSALETLGPIQRNRESVNLDRVTVEPPRDASHGDVATNAALVLAKAVGDNPRDFAAAISRVLEQDPDIESVSVAGPGFINMKLSVV